jgi:hypothetical protein
MLEYNLGKRTKKKIISFYEVGKWNIFVETNVSALMYSKTQIASKKFLNNFSFL